jgi:hypothetical protein
LKIPRATPKKVKTSFVEKNSLKNNQHKLRENSLITSGKKLNKLKNKLVKILKIIIKLQNCYQKLTKILSPKILTKLQISK